MNKDNKEIVEIPLDWIKEIEEKPNKHNVPPEDLPKVDAFLLEYGNQKSVQDLADIIMKQYPDVKYGWVSTRRRKVLKKHNKLIESEHKPKK